MKKTLLLCLSLLLSLQVTAGTPGLTAAIEEYVYTTEVEGLSEKLATEQLSKNLLALGVSEADILGELSLVVKDQAKKETYLQLLQTVKAQNLSSQDSMRLMKDMLQGQMNQGASWNGDVVFNGLFIAMIVAFIVLAATAGPGCGDETYYAENKEACDRAIENADREYNHWSWDY